MEKELQRVLVGIYEKTGIPVRVISENGLISIGFDGKVIPSSLILDSDVVVDNENNYTMFKFTFSKVNFVGIIDGVSLQEKNYASLIGGYIENNSVKGDVADYDSQISACLVGLASKNRVLTVMDKYSICKNPCYVMVYEVEKSKLNALKDFLNEYSTNEDDIAVLTSDNVCAYVKYTNENSDFDYITAKEYAQFTVKALYEELGLKVACYIGGEVKSFENAYLSYEQAMVTIRLAKSLNTQKEINSYKDYVLAKIVEELPKIRAEEYLNSLLSSKALGIFKDKTLIETAEVFLNNDLNSQETASQLYIHRNTLMYRIEKILSITGLDIRNYNDAIIFKLITLLNKE